MSNVSHTVDDLIEAVGATYRAIDIRSAAIRKARALRVEIAAVLPSRRSCVL